MNKHDLSNDNQQGLYSPQLARMTSADFAAATARAMLGAIPFVGPLVSEIVTTIIPGQRMDRIQDFLERLAERVKDVEAEVLQERMKTAECVDLLEDCFAGAVRALSEDRLEYLANLYATGISRMEADHETNKKMVSLLSQLSDAEVIWLAHLAQDRALGDPIVNNEDILYPRSTVLSSPVEERDAHAMQEAWKSRLTQLGLVKQKIRQNSRSGPEMDTFSGDWKRDSPRATWLGRMLLGYIGIEEPMRKVIAHE
ncbi:MAG: hypothetical protein ACYC27_16410 [Armatimonadota bacterium]